MCRLKAARSSRLCRLALCAAAAIYVPQVFADQLSWVGGTGDWLVAGNWIDTSNTLNQVPTSADNVSIQNGGAAQLNSGNGAAETLTIDMDSSLTISSLSTSSAGRLGVSKFEYVGSSGNGNLLQPSGRNSTGTLYLGNGSGSAGTYTLSGISLLDTNFEYIGSAGQGNFIQSGGENFFVNLTVDGSDADHTAGNYTLSGTGSLLNIAGGVEWVGYNGPGNFNQTGGANTASVHLYLGENSGSAGTYTQSAGVNSIVNSNDGFNGELDLGENSGSAGTYLLSGTGSLSVSRVERVGVLGAGNFIQTGGVNSTGALDVGGPSGGTYSLSGTGSLSIGGAEEVGSGTFIQSGGVNSTHLLYVSIGDQTSSGSYALSGSGSLSVSLNEIVGYTGTANFTQTGGTNAVAGTLTLANNGGFNRPSATYDLENGTLSAGTVVINYPGIIDYNGGTFVVANLLTVSGGEVRLGPGHNRALRVGSVSGAFIDLNDNGMIVDYPQNGQSPIDWIRELVQGGDIFSSAADATHGLGYGDNSVLGLSTFFGQSVDSSTVLVMYTYFGDANLDGTVDPADVKMLAEHWNTTGDTWSNGDFNGDGSVDVSDLYLLAQNWGAGTSSLPQLGPLLTSLGLPDVTVPEPAISVSLLMLLLPWRRRRRQ